jgi:hypothetical protein
VRRSAARPWSVPGCSRAAPRRIRAPRRSAAAS